MSSRPLLAAGAASGVGSAAALVVPALASRPVVVLLVSVLAGAGAVLAASGLSHRRAVVLVCGLLAPVVGSLACARLLVTTVQPVLVALQVLAALATWAGLARRRRLALGAALLVPAVAGAGLVAGAGAWSVDEPGAPGAPGPGTPGNGVVVAVDTHAFLVQQGTAILAGDGRTAEATFLRSPDPTAPRRPDGTHESYLWRVELGARDADRSLKHTEMPDHFFNWWTHSGKGLIAGTSGATWAEQQFALATKAWAAGDRSTAMYRLGAAAHLVGDACAPPHASPYVPDHRAYEEWVVARQQQYAVTRGGIYQEDFRLTTGHGGREWSSEHTRGWLDECAHRAAELVINTAQPPPDDPGEATSYAATMQHFRDAQRLTAGYLAFFFDSVGGP